MKGDVQFGPVLIMLHDTDGYDALIPLENIAAVVVSDGVTYVIVKQPSGGSPLAVKESPADVQQIITATINGLVKSVLQAYDL